MFVPSPAGVELDDGPRVRSVSVGLPQPRGWAGLGRTAIDKRPVGGPVRARRLGLDGDRVADTRHHGGVDQAVYSFAREDLDWWAAELDRPIRDGGFGENLTTTGIDVNEAELGERWAIGTALFEVASVRIPCNDFRGWQEENGFDAAGWVKRFTARQRPGAYLRVLTEGDVRAGDAVRVVHRPGHGVTVSTMFRALTTDRGLLPRLLVVDGLVERVRRTAEQYVQRYGDSVPAGR